MNLNNLKITFIALGLIGSNCFASELPSNLLVSDGDNLMRFDQTGFLLDQQPIPKNTSNEKTRDIVKYSNDGLALFNGTFAPMLSRLEANEWYHENFAGWSTGNNATYGGIASKDTYLYVTDGMTYNGGEAKGIVRFDISGQSPTQRFFDENEYIDLTLGLDAKLYALRNTYGDLDIIDPSNMSLIGSLDLGHTSSSRAVTADAQGNIFMASWDGSLYQYDQAGNLVHSINLSNNLYDIDIELGGTIIVSDRSGNVFITDTSLTEPTQFSASNNGVFVAFDSAPMEEPNEYCPSSGSNTYYEWIESISLNFQDVATGNNQGYYTDDNHVFNLVKGKDYSVTLQPGFNGWSYFEHWNLWIDFDQNGEFSAAEKILSEKSKHSVSASFQIPLNAKTAETRMRVSMKYDGYAEACESFYYGEVEDYRVIISD